MDGRNKAIADYIVGIVDSLDPKTYIELLKTIKKGIILAYTGNIDISKAPEYLKEGVEILQNIDTIVVGLNDYDKAYYKNYIGTTISLELIPLGKIKKVSSLTRGDTADMALLKRVNNIKRSTVPKPDLNKINSQSLKIVINDVYRDGATIGNGSTADSIRYTKVTGMKVGNSDHIEKGENTKGIFKKYLNISQKYNPDELVHQKFYKI